MPYFPVATENAMVAAGIVPTTTYYMSLHTATPGTTGASEATGGSYARQAVTFGSASGGVLSSAGSVTFSGLPVSTPGWPFWGLWTAVSSGTYLGGGVVTGAGGPTAAGYAATFSAGAFTIAVAG